MFLRVLINSGRDLQLIVYHYILSELHSLHILSYLCWEYNLWFSTDSYLSFSLPNVSLCFKSFLSRQ